MLDPIRFTIVTDDVDRALAESFGCAPTNRPGFVRVIDDPIAIERIKDGSKVLGLFYSRHCEQRRAFNDRRGFGGLVWLDDDDYEHVRDWVVLHKAAVEDRAKRFPTEIREPAIAPEDSVIAKPGKQIEKLVLSQRWT